MSAGDRVIIGGIAPGRFILQPGVEWTPTDWGWDTGRMSWLTHPNTPVSQFPKRGQASPSYKQMYVSESTHRHDESGVILIEASYRGLLDASGGGTVFKQRVVPGCDISIFSLPALIGAIKANFVAPVPKPKVVLEYVTTVQPTMEGVSQPTAAPFLPPPPTFSVSFTPDPDQPQTRNYTTGWVLDARDWDPVPIGPIWLVRETYTYYFALST